jgi:cell wall-associated NlpC family hydrolase
VHQLKYVTLLGIALSACGGAEREAEPAPAQTAPPASETQPVEVVAEPRDSVVVEEKLSWARAQRLDTLPLGSIVAQMGRTFVGSPYVPGTLEVPGPERLVVNLRTFDCVTFVESMLAFARVVRSGGQRYSDFTRELQRIRYRDGKLAGYPSRLHYFSEWISNNTSKGVVRDVTRELGGVQDPEAITFMTSHRDSYKQLADDSVFEQIKAMESRLTALPRFVIPENSIAAAAKDIRDGDVIAAATNVQGLDIAHTGIALWVDGKLHLMHAPLVGSVVEISERPLADRIIAQAKQDGIMVARPSDVQ